MQKPEYHCASVISRVGAYALDALLLFIAFPTILGAICGGIFYFTIGFDWTQKGLIFWAYLFSIVSIPFWLYYSLLESSTSQATFGMRLFGLRVTDIEGKRISFRRALLRTVIKLLPFELNHLVLFLPIPIWRDPHPGFRGGFAVVNALIILYFATMILTRRGQSIHDLVARTVVINGT